MGPDVIFWNSKFDGLGKKEYKAKDYCLYLFKSPMIVSFDEGEKKLEPWTFIGSIIKVGVPPQIGEENKKRTSISEKNLI